MSELQVSLISRAIDPIRFVIPLPPVAKGRGRHSVIFTNALIEELIACVRAGLSRADLRDILQSGVLVSTRTPEKTREAEESFRLLAKQFRPRKPLEGPLVAEFLFVLPIPTSWPPKKQAAAVSGALRPTSKPDLANFVKLAEDALTGLMWVDDSQIVSYGHRTDKIYGLRPRTEVTITQLLPGEA